MTLADEPGMPGMSKLGMPPVSATWTSISLLSSSPVAKFAAEALARRFGRIGADQRVEHARLGIEMGLRLDILAPRRLHHADRRFDEIADHLLDIAADIADLGELGRLDLDEGRIGEPRQPARDLGLADAGRPDHQDVLGHHLFAQRTLKLLAPPAVAQRDGDGALGVLLADDMAVEFGNDFAGRKVGHVYLCIRTSFLAVDGR